MLLAERRGEPYNKSAHRGALRKILSRSDGSIERKHQNISAVLIDLGYPYISGYKPSTHYQALLAKIVAEQVKANRELELLIARDVELSADVPTVQDILSRLDSPPESRQIYRPVGPAQASDNEHCLRPAVNYLEREARNASLGFAGESFVMSFERARLIHDGQDELADRVEHISVTKGDGYGYDVHSFEITGQDRLIEVKTTAYGKATPFFVSSNEVAVSRERERDYHVYRLFGFRRDPRFYALNGALERVCVLDPVQFRARVRAGD